FGDFLVLLFVPTRRSSDLFFHVGLLGVQRVVGGVVREIEKERSTRVGGSVLAQKPKGEVRHGVGGVEARVRHLPWTPVEAERTGIVGAPAGNGVHHAGQV